MKIFRRELNTVFMFALEVELLHGLPAVGCLRSFDDIVKRKCFYRSLSPSVALMEHVRTHPA